MRKALALLLVLALCPPAFAHEFWLEPEPFEIKRDEPVKLAIRVGENFSGVRWTPKSNRLSRLTMIGANEKRDLTPALEKAADGLAAPAPPPGTTIVALSTDDKFIEIAPEKFTQYLIEDGLDAALAWRAAHGAADRPGREFYRREAATLLQIGAPTEPRLDATGFDLQLLPARNPFEAHAGETLRVQVMWRGAPLANALVQRWTRGAGKDGGVDVEKARSDSQGFVSFELPAGETMLSAVHMYENEDKKAADWRSVWGNLTFHVR